MTLTISFSLVLLTTSLFSQAVKAEALSQLSSAPAERSVRALNRFRVPTRGNMAQVVAKLGQKDIDVQEWLVLTPK